MNNPESNQFKNIDELPLGKLLKPRYLPKLKKKYKLEPRPKSK